MLQSDSSLLILISTLSVPRAIFPFSWFYFFLKELTRKSTVKEEEENYIK